MRKQIVQQSETIFLTSGTGLDCFAEITAGEQKAHVCLGEDFNFWLTVNDIVALRAWLDVVEVELSHQQEVKK
jgi:hypothetical protein